MSIGSDNLKREVKRKLELDAQTLGLRNRKQKKMITYQYDTRNHLCGSIDSNGSHDFDAPKNRIQLPENTRSIRDLPNYQKPAKGIKVSHAPRPNANTVHAYIKKEQKSFGDVVKHVLKNHLTSSAMSLCNISPVISVPVSIVLNTIGAAAQTDANNNTSTWNNYTVTEGPWGSGSSPFNACNNYYSSSGSGSAYEFCNQFLVSDQDANPIVGVFSYIGITDQEWPTAELNPPSYCQDIFSRCRSIEATLGSVKTLLEQNDPSLFWGDPCIDQRSVEEGLCPSTTVFESLSPEGCFMVKGCNSTTDTSVFSKCIEQGLANSTINVNDTMNFNPGLPSTDCSIPQPSPYYPPWPPYYPPYNPPAPPSPPPSNGASPGTHSDSVASDGAFWFLISVAGCLCCIQTCKKCTQMSDNIARREEEQRAIFTAQELSNIRGTENSKLPIEPVVDITLSYLFDGPQKDKAIEIAKEKEEQFEILTVTQGLLNLSGSENLHRTSYPPSIVALTLCYLYDKSKLVKTIRTFNRNFPNHSIESQTIEKTNVRSDAQPEQGAAQLSPFSYGDDVVIDISSPSSKQ